MSGDERHMRWPTDAEGLPVRIGDVMELAGIEKHTRGVEVIGVSQEHFFHEYPSHDGGVKIVRQPATSFRHQSKDPDEGMPLWDYVRKVSRELYNDAVENMEGCGGNEWIAYNRLISIADQLRGIAERMSDERA